MIASVSQLNGTLGIRKVGKELGSSPMSPTVLTSICPNTAIIVITIIAISGEGITFVTIGNT